MEIFQRNKKVFLFIGILAAVALLYVFFFSGPSPTSGKNSLTDPTARGLVSELSVSPADVIIGRKLLSVLAELQSITLDTSIFKNPVFTSLKDKSKPIDPQPLGKAVGRRNPFSDFGKGAGSAASSIPANIFVAPQSGR